MSTHARYPDLRPAFQIADALDNNNWEFTYTLLIQARKGNLALVVWLTKAGNIRAVSFARDGQFVLTLTQSDRDKLARVLAIIESNGETTR